VRTFFAATAVLAIVVAICALGVACAARPRMCEAPTDCGSASCVAGRCQPDAGTPAVQTSRRLVFEPSDVAYLPPEGGEATTPTYAILGKDRARLFLRFAVALPADQEVIEAYVLLSRSDAYDADSTPISLHATRIVEGWNSRSTSWALQPKTEDVRAPKTNVTASGRPLVRVDVRELVQKWKKRDPQDQGIAIVAEQTSTTGMAFALGPMAETGSSGSLRGPMLELYLR
jgi:hypothetical protein